MDISGANAADGVTPQLEKCKVQPARIFFVIWLAKASSIILVAYGDSLFPSQ